MPDPWRDRPPGTRVRRCRVTLAGLVAGFALCSCSGVRRDTSEPPGLTSSDPPATAPAVAEPDMPDTSPTTPEKILPPPEGLDELAPGLLSTAQLGVPDTWAILDFDPLNLDDPEIAGDADAFRGLVSCPADVVRDTHHPWIARKASAVDEPLANGLLTVEVILKLEPADSPSGVGQLASCSAAGGATLSPTKPAVEPTGVSVGVLPAVGFQVVSPGTDDVPFAYALETLWVNDQGFTVGVVLGGQPADPADPAPRAEWTKAAEQIAAQALGQLLAGS